ncbi:MAG: hypothetical protein QM758_06950 [Armatimonas sp.]
MTSWIFAVLLILICAIAPHIKIVSYLKACVISGILVLILSTANFAIWEFMEYRHNPGSLRQLLGNFPFTLLGFVEGFVLSAIVGVPFWLYRAWRQSATKTPAR